MNQQAHSGTCIQPISEAIDNPLVNEPSAHSISNVVGAVVTPTGTGAGCVFSGPAPEGECVDFFHRHFFFFFFPNHTINIPNAPFLFVSCFGERHYVWDFSYASTINGVASKFTTSR